MGNWYVIVDFRLPYSGTEIEYAGEHGTVKVPFATRESAELAIRDMQIYVRQEHPVVVPDNTVAGEIDA